MKTVLVIGLGNPGHDYVYTRHNAGFLALEHCIQIWQLSWKKKSDYLIAEFFSHQTRFLLVQPLVYMNCSGQILPQLNKIYDIHEYVIVYDNVDLPLGRWKLRYIDKTHSTHNGLRSIQQFIHQKWYQISLGVGPISQGSLATFVLSCFSKQQLKLLNQVIYCLPALFLLWNDSWQKVTTYVANHQYLGENS